MNHVDIHRILDVEAILKHKSCFLLGPRQTGKSWLIRHQLKQHPVFNLLDEGLYLALSRNPGRLRELIPSGTHIAVIDEIQKLPSLLDQVHLLIEEVGVRFLLTGSSARKLRRSGANLLGGRAYVRHLHPFVRRELGSRFELYRALNFGLLPPVYFSPNPEEDLKAYAGTYLREEIAAEGLTRNVPAFSRFLEVAALCNGRMINFTKISNDAQVSVGTVKSYFEILKDTLIASEVPAWTQSRKRKAIGTPKFYFFDIGVTRYLQNRSPFRPGSPESGEAFEAYMFHEIKAYADMSGIGEVAYWRSISGHEVDFIWNDHAIEIKLSHTISPSDLRGLRAIREEKKLNNHMLVCQESRERMVDGIRILPWTVFLDELGSGRLD